MDEPGYRRGKYKKHKEDEMTDIKVSQALTLLNSIVDKGLKADRMLEIPKIQLRKGKGDAEEMVLLYSDMQVGHKSPTTNLHVIERRAENLAESVASIATIQQSAIKLRRLHVFMLGDMIQSEDLLTKVDLDALEMVLMDQIFKGAVPITEKLLLSVLPYFPDGIDVWCVPGNHGTISKLNAPSTNWDTLIYKILEGKMQNYKKIRWHIEEKMFYQIVNVMGKKFFLTHLDCVPSWLNIPLYGISQRSMRWQGSIEKFDYLVGAHFHTALDMDWNDVELLVNGCFMSDDQWALKRIGMGNKPTQIVFGVHPKRGISFRYKLRLDKK